MARVTDGKAYSTKGAPTQTGYKMGPSGKVYGKTPFGGMRQENSNIVKDSNAARFSAKPEPHPGKTRIPKK